MTLSFRPLAFVLLLALAPGADAWAQTRTRPEVEGRNETLRRGFAELGSRIAPHVVQISAKGRTRGYGVIIADGYVLTCNRVLPSGRSVEVQGAGFQGTASVAGRSESEDVALLRLNGAVPAGIELGSSNALEIGQFVVTMGCEATPLAVGVLSAKQRPVEPSQNQKNILLGLFSDGNEGPQRHYAKVLQHDAPIEPEQFGAPLVDASGRLVGINVHNPYRGSSHAVGIDEILPVLPQLREGGSGRPWLGVSAVELPPTQRPQGSRCALKVREATGPAAAGGVQAGDVIVKLEGRSFVSMDAFAGVLGSKRPGDTIRLTVQREGRSVELNVTLGSR